PARTGRGRLHRRPSADRRAAARRRRGSAGAQGRGARPAGRPRAAGHPPRGRPPLPALHVMTTLRLRDRTVTVQPGRPLLMGIVNAGPDSFSDAVRLDTLDAQVRHALALVEEGADLVDVGGESGVTYTEVTAADAEAARVVPLVERLAGEGVAVSVDTWK